MPKKNLTWSDTDDYEDVYIGVNPMLGQKYVYIGGAKDLSFSQIWLNIEEAKWLLKRLPKAIEKAKVIKKAEKLDKK